MKRIIRGYIPLLCALGLMPDRSMSADRPNVLLILADDMGYGDAGFNGCKDIPTPAIDSIAANGVRFTAGYVTAPQCAPSRSALLTGIDHNRIPANNNTTLDLIGLPAGPTFADRMRAAGYRTGMVGKWHLGTADGKHPLDRGFDNFFGFLGGGSRYYPSGNDASIAKLLDGREPAKVSRYLTDEFGDRAVKFITESKGRPFFLYLAFNAPHLPLQAPPEELAKFKHLQKKSRQTYAAMVSVMDQNIQKVLDVLRERGIEKDTLVIFLSDNGGPELQNGSDNGPLRGVKGDTLEGGIRVPFAVQWAGTIPPGQTVTAPVVSVDILPTALAVAGQSVPAELEGVNLLPALTGRAEYPSRTLHWLFTLKQDRTKTWWWAVREGDWNLVYFDPRRSEVKGEDTGESSVTGLFNLKEDLGESVDRSGEFPEIRQRLQHSYAAWLAGLPVPFSNLDPAMIKRSSKEALEEKP